MKKEKKRNYRSLTDAELAELSSRRDDKAFSELIVRYGRAMKHYIALYCSNPTDIEDLCQDTFRKVFLYIGSYRSDFPFRSWVMSIARNSAIDFLRRKKSYATVNLNESEDLMTGTHRDISSPEEKMIDTQSYCSFLRIVENLPDRYREIARLRFLHEYSYEQISRELDLPLNTVRTRIRRARKTISDILTSTI